MEAMARGLPVVGTRINGLVDIIEEGRHGLLVEVDDSEGLAAALGIAKQRKDAERVERYSQAMREGLRNLLQLQYNHPAELYYMSEGCRPSVLGGFRTAVYDSEIRCDNVQHALQAIRAALKHLDGL